MKFTYNYNLKTDRRGYDFQFKVDQKHAAYLYSIK